ncbi:hypothetical protein [Acinetobacter celticus]|uniref:Tip attachment protein J domain-containing protein n=1 Tax=Acinetobacter celticus TaxID=1891224 RepID=A0A1C3CV19_9GAMM|nr:hypothetical protein [Acinetobacter celticus]ODA12594.1 hypothetical protein BBP83_08475 [Acinetobacter celticus]
MGGSSSQTIGQRYFAKLAVFIGNPIEKLIGINFDNRGWVYKPNNEESSFCIEKQNLYGDKEGGVAGFVDIQTGTADQLPNVFYKADFPKVSGYPFQSYLLFRGLGQRVSGGTIGGIAGIIMGGQHYSASFYLGNSGYMKEMLLWPQRVHVRNDGSPQWYDEKAEIVAIPSVSFIDDLKFSASHATVDGAAGIIIDSGFSKDDVLVVEKTKGLTYKAWSNWSADISSENSWTNEISVTSNAGVSKFWEGYFETDDEAEEYASNHYFTLTGSTSYKFWIDDIPPDDNRGGVSLRVYKGGVSDLNPIHKIREILTDDTAMHKPESDVNDENFKKAADVLYEEKIGISWAVTEKSCLEAINELCGHIEAGIRVNRQSGLYEMVLFRDDWFKDDEIHTLPLNKIKSMQLDPQNTDETINQLNVSHYNREAIKNSSFSIAENASIKNLQGRVNAETADFPYFMNQRNAAVVAQWKLKQMSTPVWQGTFTTGFYEARKWNRYDLLKLAWPRKWSGTILVRIMKINLGAGTDVSIDFVEVVPYSSDLSSNIVIDTPVDTSPKPPQPALFKAFELSYFEAVQLNGQKSVDDALAYNPDAGYATVIAKRPQNNSLNALMYTDIGNGFERAGTIAYCETAELDQIISQTNTAFIVKNVGNIASVGIGTQITIENEIMVYQSYDTNTALLTVKRGALDSIPQMHSAGSVLYFADDFITVDSTEYVTSEVIEVKALTTTPSGILDIENVDAQQVEIHARAIRPYPPANIKINEEYWPIELETDLVLTWVDRNRVQQTGGSILGWFDSGVMIEQDTQTHLILTQFDENDVELATTNANVTGTTNYTMPISLMQADTRTVEIVLKTVRDGYECLNPFIHIVELSQFFSAPFDLTVEFKND